MVRVFSVFHMMGRDVLVFEVPVSSANSNAAFKAVFTAAVSTKIISTSVAQTGVSIFCGNREKKTSSDSLHRE
jgi:hypothetical protein